jgi:CIC family chloride channel protein
VIPDLIRAEAANPWAWTLLLALLFGKMVACPLTVGSGGSGGIFIPYLLMGAALGGLVGRVVGAHFPWAAPSGAYMLVGMGAVFGGITFAPFTAILLLFELTRDYSIILPMMFTVGVTLLVARAIDPESMESKKLLKKGVRLHEHPELRALERYHVRDIMSRVVRTVPADFTLSQVADFVSDNPHTGYPVVEKDGRPIGLLTFGEMQKAFGTVERAPGGGTTVRDIMRDEVPAVSPDDPLVHAIRKMQTTGADRVLVLDAAASQPIAGIVTKGDILSIYRRFFDEA